MGINLKSIGAKTLNGTINVGKIATAVAIAIATAEAVFFGFRCANADVKACKSYVKYKTNPDVYKVKKGWFGKTHHINVNPITFKTKPDKTGKAPVNKKVIML